MKKNCESDEIGNIFLGINSPDVLLEAIFLQVFARKTERLIYVR